MKFCKWKYYYVVDRLDRSLSAEIKTRQVESLPSKLGKKRTFLISLDVVLKFSKKTVITNAVYVLFIK